MESGLGEMDSGWVRGCVVDWWFDGGCGLGGVEQ